MPEIPAAQRTAPSIVLADGGGQERGGKR